MLVVFHILKFKDLFYNDQCFFMAALFRKAITDVYILIKKSKSRIFRNIIKKIKDKTSNSNDIE